MTKKSVGGYEIKFHDRTESNSFYLVRNQENTSGISMGNSNSFFPDRNIIDFY